jgi:excisionase family DNA binding protein
MTEDEVDPIRILIFGTPTNPTGVGHTLCVLADLVGAHYMTVLSWITKGDLLAYKFGKSWTIASEDAIAFLRSRSNQALMAAQIPDISDEPLDDELPRRDIPPNTLG